MDLEQYKSARANANCDALRLSARSRYILWSTDELSAHTVNPESPIWRINHERASVSRDQRYFLQYFHPQFGYQESVALLNQEPSRVPSCGRHPIRLS